MNSFPLVAYAALVVTFLAGIAMPPPQSRDAVSAAASTSAAPSAAPAGPKPPNVDFADTQPIVVDRETPAGYTFTVSVRNEEPAPTKVEFSAALQNSNGNTVPVELKVAAGQSLQPFSVTPVTVTITSSNPIVPPISGYVMLGASASTGAGTGAAMTHKYRAIKIAPGLPSRAADLLLSLSIGAAALAVLVSLSIFLSHKVALGSEMGVPTWSFADSWGSNIAVAGALLTQLLGLLLPEQTRYLNKTAYAGLSLIFGTLIALAPALYSLCRRPVSVPGPPPSVTYHGYVWAFVVASGITLWGAFGQFGTIAVLLADLCQARQISPALLVAFETVVGVMAVALFVYGIVTMNAAAKTRRSAAAAAAAAAAKGGAPTPEPQWALL